MKTATARCQFVAAIICALLLHTTIARRRRWFTENPVDAYQLPPQRFSNGFEGMEIPTADAKTLAALAKTEAAAIRTNVTCRLWAVTAIPANFEVDPYSQTFAASLADSISGGYTLNLFQNQGPPTSAWCERFDNDGPTGVEWRVLDTTLGAQAYIVYYHTPKVEKLQYSAQEAEGALVSAVKECLKRGANLQDLSKEWTSCITSLAVKGDGPLSYFQVLSKSAAENVATDVPPGFPLFKRDLPLSSGKSSLTLTLIGIPA